MGIDRPGFMSEEVHCAIQGEVHSHHSEGAIKTGLMLIHDHEQLASLYERIGDRIHNMRDANVEEILTFELYARGGDKMKSTPLPPVGDGFKAVAAAVGTKVKRVIKSEMANAGIKVPNPNFRKHDNLGGALALVDFVKDNPKGYRDFVKSSYEGKDPGLSLGFGGGHYEFREIDYPPVEKGADGLPYDYVRFVFDDARERLNVLRETADRGETLDTIHNARSLLTDRMDLLHCCEKKYVAMQEKALGVKQSISKDKQTSQEESMGL